jgi:hypothetical protein
MRKAMFSWVVHHCSREALELGEEVGAERVLCFADDLVAGDLAEGGFAAMLHGKAD